MEAKAPLPQERPTLRLYSPPDEITGPPDQPPESSGVTLSELYYKSVRPILEREGRSRDTLLEHERAIRRFEHFCNATATTGQDANHRTTRPVVRSITAKMLAEYREWLGENDVPDARGKMRRTGKRAINKDLGYLSMMLGYGAESGDTDGAVRVRRVPLPKAGDPLEIPDEHLSAIFRACDVAEWPARDSKKQPFGVPAPLVWRFALVWYANYGPRVEDLMPYTTDCLPICWGHICYEAENPHHNGSASNEHGWFFFVPFKTRRVKPDPLTLPINATARYWLDRLAEASPDRSPQRPLLPLPKASKTFYRTWATILEEAKVAPKPLLRVDPATGIPERISRSYLLKDLRSTAATRIENHAKGVGKLVTGHAASRAPDSEVDVRIFEESYYNAESAIVAALSTIPQPEAFTATA